MAARSQTAAAFTMLNLFAAMFAAAQENEAGRHHELRSRREADSEKALRELPQ